METESNRPDSQKSQDEEAVPTSMNTADGGKETSNGGLPIARGFIYGILAFAVGYLATYLHKSGEAADAAVQGSSPETWKAVGWVFIVLHHSTLEVSGNGNTENIGTDSLSESWMLLIPILALLGAGYLLVARTPDWKNVSGPKAGAAIAVGYVICMAGIAIGTEWTTTVEGFMQSTEVTYQAKMAETVVIGGIIYPVVLGGVGGLFASSG